MASDATPDAPNIGEWLARMAPPDTPAEAIELCPELNELTIELDPMKSAAALAGLMTDTRFQANHIRIDFALRIVLARGLGRRKLGQKVLGRLLNHALVEARVARLEDPIEDFFTDVLPTTRGDMLMFTGLWEKAASHTESLLRAFAALPAWGEQGPAIERAYALLRVSDALVRRSGLGRRAIGQDHANQPLAVPSDQRLQVLAQRVRFRRADLASLQVRDSDLDPFFLASQQAQSLSETIPGDSALEARPLLRMNDGIVVAAPANISTAIRMHLINTAVATGRRDDLCRALLEVHAELVRFSGFENLEGMQRIPETGGLMRHALHQISTGWYVHVVQTVDDFAGWPIPAFGSTLAHPPEELALVTRSIRAAKRFMEAQDQFAGGITLWLTGGWGRSRSIDLDLGPDLSGWLLLAIEPADAMVLGSCEDGSLSDVWRLNRQLALVASQGFEFFAINGILNLFHWWRFTEHALVPPHMIDVTPPITINFDTNMLLEARREAAHTLDRRALEHPDGSYHLVSRLERRAVSGALKPIYASVDAARMRRLLGAVLYDQSRWWVALLDDGKHPHAMAAYRVWDALLRWLDLTMPVFLAPLKGSVQRQPVLIQLEIYWDGVGDLTKTSDAEAEGSVRVAVDVGHSSVHVELLPGWHQVLRRADNRAEFLLVVRTLVGVARLLGVPLTESQLGECVRHAVGSPDFRWIHSFEARTTLEALAAQGLVDAFHPIPKSAAAIAKCGAVWITRPREAGVFLEGKEACVSFLTDHRNNLLARLNTAVREYDPETLIVANARCMQSALDEQRHWRLTARALRAVHGVSGDFEASLERANQANGILRAGAILIELSSAATADHGHRAAGRLDIEELQARAVMLFGIGDLLAAVHGDRVTPTFRISPTGDLLYEHDFEEMTIQRTAKLSHERDRESASQEYAKRFEAELRSSEVNGALQMAIAAEFGVPYDLFVQFPGAAGRIAAKQASDVIALPRSEFVHLLESADPALEGIAPLVDRLTLPARNGWDDHPVGTSPGDFDLAKFDRRFSLIGRPIVALSNAHDPRVVVGPALIERTYLHSVSGATTGSLQNEFWTSTEMRTFASKAGAESGLAFNQQVADALEALKLRAWPSAKPSWCLNEKATNALKALGDIDVLAVSADGQRVWVVEAKDLKLCRTLGEAARRLSEYRGKLSPDGKPDKLLRHLRRVEYLRARAEALRGRLKLADVPKVSGVVIVHAPQPMEGLQAQQTGDGAVVMLSDIEKVPWSRGW